MAKEQEIDIDLSETQSQEEGGEHPQTLDLELPPAPDPTYVESQLAAVQEVMANSGPTREEEAEIARLSVELSGGGEKGEFANDAEFQAARAQLENDVYGNSGPETFIEGQQVVSDAEFEAAKRQFDQEVHGQAPLGEVVATEEMPSAQDAEAQFTSAPQTDNDHETSASTQAGQAVASALRSLRQGASTAFARLKGVFTRTRAGADDHSSRDTLATQEAAKPEKMAAPREVAPIAAAPQQESMEVPLQRRPGVLNPDHWVMRALQGKESSVSYRMNELIDDTKFLLENEQDKTGKFEGVPHSLVMNGSREEILDMLTDKLRKKYPEYAGRLTPDAVDEIMTVIKKVPIRGKRYG